MFLSSLRLEREIAIVFERRDGDENEPLMKAFFNNGDII